jgi:hypothetical protein
VVIVVRLLLLPLVIVFALPLVVIGGFDSLAVIGHATNIITGLTISLRAAVLPVTVIAAGILIAYSVDGGLYGVALAAVAMLSMAGIVVAVDSYSPIPSAARSTADRRCWFPQRPIGGVQLGQKPVAAVPATAI